MTQREPQTPRARKSRATSRATFEWYRARPNELHHYGECADDLGMDRTHVNASVNRMAHIEGMNIHRGGEAGYYLYRWNPRQFDQAVLAPESAESSKDEYYEKVGITTAGVPIVRDEKGVLWVLRELAIKEG